MELFAREWPDLLEKRAAASVLAVNIGHDHLRSDYLIM